MPCTATTPTTARCRWRPDAVAPLPPLRPLSLAYLADFYVSWMGGANILGFQLQNVLRAAPAQQASVHVLLDARHLPAAMQADIRDFLPVQREQIDAGGALRCLLDAAPDLPHLIFYKDLAATLDLLEVNVIAPTGENLGAAHGRPWFAYLPDFQHQYLPQYFSAAERRRRDAHFRAQLEACTGVFVNSATVAADVARFYPGASSGKRIHRFAQLYPEVGSGFVDRRRATQEKFDQRAPYLLSCSQRWMHKQHECILLGFAEFLRRCLQSPLQLVFTGDKGDHRDPAYAATVEGLVDRLGLRARVRHLGLVAREDQLQLIAGAHAVLQASQFEGGPGASGTLEAALLGTTIIASDIGANRELEIGHTRFFDTHRTDALAQVIESLGEPHGEAHRHRPYDAEQIAFLGTASGLQMLATMRAALP